MKVKRSPRGIAVVAMTACRKLLVNDVMPQPPTNCEVRKRHTFDLGINRPGDLDLWPFDLEPDSRYCPWGGQPSYQLFDVFATFCSRLMVHHLSDASRDLLTLTFNLVRHGGCREYMSSCFIRVPSLKFVGLPVPKIWHTFDLRINRLGDLDLWLLTLKLVHRLRNFGVSVTFYSLLMGQQLLDKPRDLSTLTFDLGGHCACPWYRFSAPSVYQVRSF